MIRINLIPAEEANRAAGQRRETATVAVVVGTAVLVLALAHSWQQARIMTANRALSRINQEIATLQGSYAEISRMDQQKQELREKLKVIGQLETKSGGPVKVLADLSAATPDRLWLTELAEAGGQVKLTGFGVDEQTVAEFLRRLSVSPFFRSVDLQETSQDDKSGLKEKKFVITAAVNYLGPQVDPAAAGTPAAPDEPAKRNKAARGGPRTAAVGRTGR